MNSNVNNLTFLGIDGTGLDFLVLKAIKYSKIAFPNCKAKFLTSGNHAKIYSDVEHIKIDPLNYDDFSVFCLTEMHKYIDTEFIIYCHRDGFLVNSSLWNNDFLNYDYIGAPWSHHNLMMSSQRHSEVKKEYEKSNYKYKIGNGGFSLRSKRLLEATASLYSREYYGIAEDLLISIVMRKKLENMGLKFVNDVEFAATFSCEETNIDGKIFSSNNSLGFHRDFMHPDKIQLLNFI